MGYFPEFEMGGGYRQMFWGDVKMHGVQIYVIKHF